MTLADLRRANGTILSCAAVPTFVRAVGDGPPVLVLHGGPGFSHGYLRAALGALAPRRTLVFFDQPGCGASGLPDAPPTLELLADQARALVRLLVSPGEPVGLLAHSWGALVALAADLPATTGVHVGEGLVVAPAAPTRAGWDDAVARLLGRIPAEVATALLGRFASEPDTAFDPLLPFYCAVPVPSAAGELRVRGPVYLATAERLGDYDLRPQAGRLLPAVDLVLGRFDFTTPALLDDMVAAARATTLLDTGHFPFWEDPVGFERVLRQAFP